MTKRCTKDPKNTEKSEKEQFGSLEVSVSFLARLFGKTERTVTDWCNKRGCPKLGHGRFDLRAVLDWWLENIYESTAEASDESIQDVKRRYWAAKAEREEIRVAQEKGKLIQEDEVSHQWALRMGEVANGLEMFVYRLPPLLEGRNQAEMRAILDDAQWKLRDHYCRAGKFCPPPEEHKDQPT